MILRATASGPQLDEPNDFTALELRLDSVARESLSSWARWDGADHVRVEPETLVAAAGQVALEPGWQEGFTAMLSYASQQGWVDDGGRVRVHVVRAPAAG